MSNLQATKPKTLHVLGVPVCAIDLDRTVDRVLEWLAAGKAGTVLLATAHGVMDARRNDEVCRAFAHVDLVVPDGMSMVWLLKLTGHPNAGRVYGPDLMKALCRASVESGATHFLLGGREEVANRLTQRLEEYSPGLHIAGRYSPPFRPWNESDDDEIVRRIHESGARIVWVGLGSPKQDLWIAAQGYRLPGTVLIGVGAAFDFLSGAKRQAPRWIQRSGFEWLFRLACEPQRLWPRYSRYPWFGLLILARLPGWIWRRH